MKTMKLATLLVLAQVIAPGMAHAVNLLSNGDFSDNLNGWTTFSDGAAPAFDAATDVATITKNSGTGENWSTGVIYQVVNVPAGTPVKLSGEWAGNLSGAGGMWWSEIAVYSVPDGFDLGADPHGDGHFNYLDDPPETPTYAGYQNTYLGAFFDYPGNVANFPNVDVNGGTYAGAADFLNTFGNNPTATWSLQDIALSQYNAAAAEAAAPFTWLPLERQMFNIPNGTIMSLGQVVVALKFGSQFDDDGVVSFDNLSLVAVPEPAAMALGTTGLGLLATHVVRKRRKTRL